MKAWNYDNPKKIEFLFRLFFTQLHIVLLANNIGNFFFLHKIVQYSFLPESMPKIPQVLKYSALIYISVHSSTVHGLGYLRPTSCVRFKNLK